MVRPAYESRVYFSKTGGVISSLDTCREGYMHGSEVHYRQVPTYKCTQIDDLSYYDFENIKFKVTQSRGAYRIVVDEDETRQNIKIWVEGVGVYEGINLGGTFKQFPTHRRPAPKTITGGIWPPEAFNGPPTLIYKPEWDKNIRVTICTATLARPETTKATLTALKKYADFPSRFIVLINPELKKLIKWAKDNEFEVWSGAFVPIVLAKRWMMDNLETEFLLIHDCDWVPQINYKPLLELMDVNPEVGVVAPMMEHKTERSGLYGSMLQAEGKQVKRLRLKKKTIQDQHGDAEWFLCDYVTMSSMLIRKTVLDEVKLDPEYGQGYDHDDFFMQLKNTKWRIASHRQVQSKALDLDPTSEWYNKLRWNQTTINQSVERFQEKWGKPLRVTWI